MITIGRFSHDPVNFIHYNFYFLFLIETLHFCEKKNSYQNLDLNDIGFDDLIKISKNL